MQQIVDLGRLIVSNARDVLPVVLVIALFQGAVIGKPIPQLCDMLIGLAFVLVGLTFLVRGLTISVFAIGQDLADALAKRGNLALLLVFAFALGFSSTVAEPALHSVARKGAAAAAAAGLLEGGSGADVRFAVVLQYASSAAVGLALAIGCLRIVLGWPLAWLVVGGYGLVALLVLTGASPLAGVALDAGAAATSVINIPLITALGVGLASAIRGRNPMSDGFGMVALASLMPILAVLIAAAIL